MKTCLLRSWTTSAGHRTRRSSRFTASGPGRWRTWILRTIRARS